MNCIKEAIESYEYYMTYENTDNDNLSFYEVFFYTDGITFDTEHNTMKDYDNPNSFLNYYMNLRE